MSHYLYSANYSPAAPVVEIILGAPGKKPTLGPLVALIDTGADATIIPINYLRQAEAERTGRAVMRSHWGESRSVLLYAVAVQIGHYQLAAPWVVADDSSDEIVLGRNIINRLRLLLDGPAAVMELLPALY